MTSRERQEVSYCAFIVSCKSGTFRMFAVMDIDGNSLGVQVKGGKMDVNGTHVTTPDIFASNGVVHIIDNLLLPHDFKLLNSPEKQLLSLNATRFVSLLRMANLSETYTARHSDQPYTILAPTDDVLERMGRWEKPIWGALLEDSINFDSPPAFDRHFADVLKEQLLYHILPEKLSLKELRDGMLLETELALDGLGGHRQRIKVDIGPHKDGGDQALGIANIKIGDAVLTAEPGKPRSELKESKRRLIPPIQSKAETPSST
jgi:solute carrier family 25 carnitine/acylcarnitine transporter 20/29